MPRTVQEVLRVVDQNPQVLTCNSYLNFLRFYKVQHPRFGLRRILQNASKLWTSFNSYQRMMFKQRVYKASNSIPQYSKWLAKWPLLKVPRQRMSKSYKRFYMNTRKNVRKRRRNNKLLKYQPRKVPAYFK